MVNAAVQCSEKTCLRGMCWKNCSRMVHSHKKNDLAGVQVSGFVSGLQAVWLLQYMVQQLAKCLLCM